MNKLPYIERPYDGAGLTGECAYLWAVFLANEADMSDDHLEYDRYKMIAEQLAPKQGVPVPASVHYSDLEDAIARYIK